MKILIIGASRGIGACLLEQALAAGHTATVLARKPEAITTQDDGLVVKHGDICDEGAVSEAVAGMDAVFITIGVPITFRPVTVFSKGTGLVIHAMQNHGVRHLLAVTGIGAGDSKGHGGFLYDSLFKPLFLKTIYTDKDVQEEYIKNSRLDWVIARPAGLTNGPRTGSYRVITELAAITAKRISRADVADFLLKELEEKRYLGQTPLLTY